MYRYSNGQISLSDFKQPVGMNLKESNRWVKKAQTIPWTEVEKRYAALFTNRKGNVAKPLRLALGACIIQAEYDYSDDEITLQIQENPYQQENDLLLCLGGGLLMYHGLEIRDESEIVLGPYGKPALRNQEKEFNPSHSGDWCLMTVSGFGLTGVDIERVNSPDLRAAPSASACNLPRRRCADGNGA